VVLAEEAVLRQAQGQGQGLGLPPAGEAVGGAAPKEEDQVVPVGPHQGLAPEALLLPPGREGLQEALRGGLLQPKAHLSRGQGLVDALEDGQEALQEAAPQKRDLLAVAGELLVPDREAVAPRLQEGVSLAEGLLVGGKEGGVAPGKAGQEVVQKPPPFLFGTQDHLHVLGEDEDRPRKLVKSPEADGPFVQADLPALEADSLLHPKDPELRLHLRLKPGLLLPKADQVLEGPPHLPPRARWMARRSPVFPWAFPPTRAKRPGGGRNREKARLRKCRCRKVRSRIRAEPCGKGRGGRGG
jgi:hypothetical protein